MYFLLQLAAIALDFLRIAVLLLFAGLSGFVFAWLFASIATLNSQVNSGRFDCSPASLRNLNSLLTESSKQNSSSAFAGMFLGCFGGFIGVVCLMCNHTLLETVITVVAVCACAAVPIAFTHIFSIYRQGAVRSRNNRTEVN